MFSKYCESSIDYKSPTHGNVIHGIKDMAHQFINSYSPVESSRLTLTLRRCRLVDFKADLNLKEIINVIFNALRLELGDSTHCADDYQIHRLENNIHTIHKYFDQISNGFIDEYCGIKMKYHQICVNCRCQWHKFVIENVINVPVHGLHARYWIYDEDGDIMAYSFDVVPMDLCSMSLEQLIMLAVQDHEVLDSDHELTIEEKHFVCIGKARKYMVYCTCLQQLANGMVWSPTLLKDITMDAYEYVNQLKFTIVLCEIPDKVTNYIFNFKTNTVEFTDINKIMPTGYVDIEWQQQQESKQESKQDDEKNNVTLCTEIPKGDAVISLLNQWEKVLENGYIIEDKCHRCDKIQKIVTKPTIYQLPPYPIMYIDQQNAHYYKLLWPYSTNKLHLPINSKKQMQSKRMYANYFMSYGVNDDYAAHWKSPEPAWYTILQNQVKKDESVENIKEISQHACVLYLTLRK